MKHRVDLEQPSRSRIGKDRFQPDDHVAATKQELEQVGKRDLTLVYEASTPSGSAACRFSGASGRRRRALVPRIPACDLEVHVLPRRTQIVEEGVERLRLDLLGADESRLGRRLGVRREHRKQRAALGVGGDVDRRAARDVADREVDVDHFGSPAASASSTRNAPRIGSNEQMRPSNPTSRRNWLAYSTDVRADVEDHVDPERAQEVTASGDATPRRVERCKVVADLPDEPPQLVL